MFLLTFNRVISTARHGVLDFNPLIYPIEHMEPKENADTQTPVRVEVDTLIPLMQFTDVAVEHTLVSKTLTLALVVMVFSPLRKA